MNEHDEVKQAILAGNIQAEYSQPPEEPRGVKEKPQDEIFVGEEDMTDSEWEFNPETDPDMQGPASPSPEIDWEEDGGRIQRKVARRLKKLAGEILSDWDSETSEDEEESKKLKEGLTPKPKGKKGGRKGKGKGKGKA